MTGARLVADEWIVAPECVDEIHLWLREVSSVAGYRRDQAVLAPGRGAERHVRRLLGIPPVCLCLVGVREGRNGRQVVNGRSFTLGLYVWGGCPVHDPDDAGRYNRPSAGSVEVAPGLWYAPVPGSEETPLGAAHLASVRARLEQTRVGGAAR